MAWEEEAKYEKESLVLKRRHCLLKGYVKRIYIRSNRREKSGEQKAGVTEIIVDWNKDEQIRQ